MNIWHEAKNGRLLVAGHRGFKARYPENTMPSFQAAADLGVDMIEIDIALSSDGVPVLCHDRTLERTSNGKGPVRDHTLEALKALDFGGWFSPKFAGLQISTLAEFLDWAKAYPNILLNIDMKGGDEALMACDAVYKLVREKTELSRCVFNTHDGRVVERMHEYGVFVEGAPKGFYSMCNFDDGPDGTYSKMNSICLAYRDISPDSVALYKSMGFPVWTWGANTRQEVQNALACGVSLMVCDDPRAALDIAEKKRSR